MRPIIVRGRQRYWRRLRPMKKSARLPINILVHTGVFDGLPKIAVYLVGLEPWVKDVQVRPAPL